MKKQITVIQSLAKEQIVSRSHMPNKGEQLLYEFFGVCFLEFGTSPKGVSPEQVAVSLRTNQEKFGRYYV